MWAAGAQAAMLSIQSGRLFLPIALALLLSGCLGGRDSTETMGGPRLTTRWLDDRPPLNPPSFREPVDLGIVDIGAEPNVAVDAHGVVYVSSPIALWKSLDGGATFQQLGDPACRKVYFEEIPSGTCPPGYETRRPPLEGGGDGDLATDATGKLYWVGLGGSDWSVPFQTSSDHGETWTEPIDVADGEAADRQWLSVNPDGKVDVTWRTFGSADRLRLRSSPDGGQTWGPLRNITNDRLAGPHVRDGLTDNLYVPYWEDGIRIARSINDGAAWEHFLVHANGRDSTLRLHNPTYIFPVVAVDEAGALYAAWADDPPSESVAGLKEVARPRIQFSTSGDGGATWSAPATLSTPGKSALFPWIVAGKPGRVAVAWYEDAIGLPNENLPDLWNVRLAESVTADHAIPEWTVGQANREPIHLGSICTDGGWCVLKGKDRSLLDFFEIAIGVDGHPVLAWAADGDQPRLNARVFSGRVVDGTPLR